MALDIEKLLEFDEKIAYEDTTANARVITTEKHRIYIFKDHVAILRRPNAAAETDSQTGY